MGLLHIVCVKHLFVNEFHSRLCVQAVNTKYSILFMPKHFLILFTKTIIQSYRSSLIFSLCECFHVCAIHYLLHTFRYKYLNVCIRKLSLVYFVTRILLKKMNISLDISCLQYIKLIN